MDSFPKDFRADLIAEKLELEAQEKENHDCLRLRKMIYSNMAGTNSTHLEVGDICDRAVKKISTELLLLGWETKTSSGYSPRDGDSWNTLYVTPIKSKS
jgi:hypothetical protein